MAHAEAERLPLLTILERTRGDVSLPHDCEKLVKTWTHSPGVAFLLSTGGWMLQVFTVFGSYFWLVSAWKLLTPKCHQYEQHQLHFMIGCNVAGFCFWTLPLLCAMVAVFTAWRHYYKSRLYYECLIHKVMMYFELRETIHSPFTWFLVVYAVLAFSLIFFPVGRDPSIPAEYKKSEGMMIYFAPLSSFLASFLAMWQVEDGLIPLPRFYEADPALAKEVFVDAIITSEMQLRSAFEEVEDALDARHAETLTPAEYFALLAEVVRRQNSAVADSGALETAPSYGSLQPKEGAVVGLGRSEVLTWSHRIFKGSLFACRLLHSHHFADERSLSFRWWARLHTGCCVVVTLCIAEIYFSTGVDFFREQRLM